MATLTKTEWAPAAPETAGKTSFLTPPANIRETKDAYILQAEMPGVGKEGLEVTVDNNELVIIGHRRDTEVPGNALYSESRHLDYRRVFDLDPSIDRTNISAQMHQGVLTLTLPKAEQVKPRKITVSD